MRLHTPALKEFPCQKRIINVVSRKNTGAEKTIENIGVFENGCTYMTLYCASKTRIFLVSFLLGERDVRRVEVVRAKQISCDHAFLFLLCQPVLFLVSMKKLLCSYHSYFVLTTRIFS